VFAGILFPVFSLAISQCARLLTAVSRVIVMASTKAYYSQTNKSNNKSHRMDMYSAIYDLKHLTVEVGRKK
jgi:hypothetical protein